MVDRSKQEIVASDDDWDEDGVENNLESFLGGIYADLLDENLSGDTSETTAMEMEAHVMLKEVLRERVKQLNEEETKDREKELGLPPPEVLKEIPVTPMDYKIARKDVYGNFPALVVEPRGIQPIGIGRGRGRGITKLGKFADPKMLRVEAQAKGFICEETSTNGGFQNLENGKYEEVCQAFGSTSSSSLASDDGQDNFRKPRKMTPIHSVFDSEFDSLVSEMNLGN